MSKFLPGGVITSAKNEMAKVGDLLYMHEPLIDKRGDQTTVTTPVIITSKYGTSMTYRYLTQWERLRLFVKEIASKVWDKLTLRSWLRHRRLQKVWGSQIEVQHNPQTGATRYYPVVDIEPDPGCPDDQMYIFPDKRRPIGAVEAMQLAMTNLEDPDGDR